MWLEEQKKCISQMEHNFALLQHVVELQLGTAVILLHVALLKAHISKVKRIMCMHISHYFNSYDITGMADYDFLKVCYALCNYCSCNFWDVYMHF